MYHWLEKDAEIYFCLQMCDKDEGQYGTDTLLCKIQRVLATGWETANCFAHENYPREPEMYG